MIQPMHELLLAAGIISTWAISFYFILKDDEPTSTAAGRPRAGAGKFAPMDNPDLTDGSQWSDADDDILRASVVEDTGLIETAPSFADQAPEGATGQWNGRVSTVT